MPECWAYKAFHCMEPADKLLYVGISDTPGDRMTQHARDKWWWHLANRIEWFRFPSREAAAENESNAIEKLRPLFNKQQNQATAGETLLGCLEILKHSFHHCPICFSSCQYSVVNWKAKWLARVDVGEEIDAHCFEVWMSCEKSHALAEWCHFIPIDILCTCFTKMPEDVLEQLWSEADSNGEIGEDISKLRPPTLAEILGAQRSFPELCAISVERELEATDAARAG